MKSIYKEKIGISKEVRVLQSATLPVLMWEAQTWALTKTLMKKVRAIQCKMEKPIMGLRWDDKVTNSEVIKVTQMEDVGYKTKKVKGKLVEDVSREVGQKWNQEILNWRPYENTRGGRPALR